MKKELSRRNFLAGASIAAVGAAATMIGCSDDTPPAPVGDGITWVAEADYVILGTGGAGLSAAATCGLEDLGTALILEAAPYELRGGNSRVCGQGLFCPKSVEGAIEYQTDLNLPFVVDPVLMRAWAENICDNGRWMIEECGADIIYRESAEFPEMKASDLVGHYASVTARDEEGNGGMWKAIWDTVAKFDIPIYYDSRGVNLIQDPKTKEVYGVTTEDGRNFKAHKAVILGTGGFEWNQEMMDQFSACGFLGAKGIGTTYNVGDGIKMSQKLGAQLWHMNNFSGKTFGMRIGAANDDSRIAGTSFSSDLHDFIFVDPKGKRFMYEESRGLARHGKVYEGGTWADLRYPKGGYVIFGQESYDKGSIAGTVGFTPRLTVIQNLTTNNEMLAAGIFKKSQTVKELAAAINCPEANIQATLDFYNECVALNHDSEYHRGQPLSEEGVDASAQSRGAADVQVSGFDLTPIEPPYYTFEMIPFVINTQGGPQRGAKGEVIHVDGKPIPRLYAAGEMGVIYPYLYNVGGNFSESISSGRLAVRSASALEPREE